MVLIASYLGRWPAYTPWWLETARRNPLVDFWLLWDTTNTATDTPGHTPDRTCLAPRHAGTPSNVYVFKNVLSLMNERLRNFSLPAINKANAYSYMCDIRPWLGAGQSHIVAPLPLFQN